MFHGGKGGIWFDHPLVPDTGIQEELMLKKMDHVEYPSRLRGYSVSMLRFIIADAQAAMRALPDNPNNSYYADEVCYCVNELNKRPKV